MSGCEIVGVGGGVDVGKSELVEDLGKDWAEGRDVDGVCCELVVVSVDEAVGRV